MRRCLILYGLTCIIAQILALREIAVAFHGNELVYGAVLAAWLLLVAVGSGFVGRLAERHHLSVPAFALTLAGGGATVPITVLLVRLARWVMVGRSGVTPSFAATLLAVLLILAPLCLMLGFFYALACAINMRLETSPIRAATRVYVFEAIGTFVGGVLFTYVLVLLLPGFLIALGVAAADCLAAFAVWRHDLCRRRPWGWVLLVASVLFVSMLLSPVGTIIDFASQAGRFSGQVLRNTTDTPYGRIDVVRIGDQTGFYQSGTLAGATRMDQAAEERAFIALLAHPAPQRALIIGGCVSGVLRKALEVPGLLVDYVELDPALIQMARRFGDPLDRAALDSARVRVFTNTDGRLFIKRTETKYDVILSAVPNPTTGLINRFYTLEFFSEARRALSDGGVLALSLDGPPAYMNAPHHALAVSIHQTLQCVFGAVVVLPSDNAIYYLASPGDSAGFPETTVWPTRLQERGISAAWLTPGTLREITNPHHVGALRSRLSTAQTPSLNTDLRPIAYYHALLLWSEAFKAHGQGLLKWALSVDLWGVLLLVTIITGISCLGATFAPKPIWVGLPTARAYAGMAGFVLQMVLIFAFQSLYGYAYSQLGMIFAAFMVGITLGAAVAGRLDLAPSELKALMLLQTALALLATVIVPILIFLERSGPTVTRLGAVIVIPLLNLCVGALVGAQYPISMAACSGTAASDHRPARLAAGLYAMDLAGACLGALLGGTLLIPVLGLSRTCWAMSALSIASLPLLLLSERRRVQSASRR